MFNKRKSFIITLCILLPLLIFLSCKITRSTQSQETPEQPVTLTEHQEQLVRELNQWLIPLGPSPLDLTDNELSFLDQLKNAKIIALGEATHGTREFFQMKHRIFQYLVEHHRHKAFGFEADFAECIYLNNYVTKGEGDLTNLMRTRMQFYTWKTEEVRELLEWMKDYNLGKEEEEKIHYIGFDCQFTTYQPDLLQEYLQQTSPGLWETASPVLEQVTDLSRDDYSAMPKETYNDIKTQLESLENLITANKDHLIANSSSNQYEINKQLLKTFKQAFIVIYHLSIRDNSTNWRDRFMAENALWIADFFGQDTRITLWAHNGHIARNPVYGGDGSMGYHLYIELNDLYQALGFSFSKGSFTAYGIDQQGNVTTVQIFSITSAPKSDSINFIFHHASHSNFVFHLDVIPTGSHWDNWLANPIPFLMIGGSYNGVIENYYRATNIRDHYNWIIYFDFSSASQLL
ncbi:MAG: erythromycin esterase family protein [Candidatus Aminicenantes bacterium]|nr:MAG: erythromycin esterase family protein [Candidatus Aminicenantes bacterium]